MMQLLHNPYFILFAVLFFGLLLGEIRIWGLNLGASGVLFTALLAGHFELTIPAGVGEVGLALFVYCVGLGVGNRFFGSLVNRGNKLALVSLIIVVSAACITYFCAIFLDIPAGIAAGIFAGACTSTPALAAANEALVNLPDLRTGVSIGYGIAYPFGVVGVVLFVQLLPRLLKKDISVDAGNNQVFDTTKIVARLVQIANPNLVGQMIASPEISQRMDCRITRLVMNDRLVPLSPEDKFAMDQQILIIGTHESVEREALFYGKIVENPYPINSEKEKDKVIALKKNFCGHTIRELRVFQSYGIIISRISRLGFTFVPTDQSMILRNDVLTVVGQPESIVAFKKVVGHRSQEINTTDMLSLAGGLMLGILIGNIQIGIGPESKFSLGIAGGPLMVALVLGHFGKVGPMIGFIPRPTRMLLQDFGLILFLANAGIIGGADVVKTVTMFGPTVFVMGALITVIPMVLSYILATKYLKLSFLESLGGICGGITSTPALGAIASKTDSQVPVVSYATAYPVALILMTLFAKAIITLLVPVLS